MPRYDYTCVECDKTVELSHGMQEEPSVPCPSCGYKMVKVFAVPGLQFKGGGWGGQ